MEVVFNIPRNRLKFRMHFYEDMDIKKETAFTVLFISILKTHLRVWIYYPPLFYSTHKNSERRTIDGQVISILQMSFVSVVNVAKL